MSGQAGSWPAGRRRLLIAAVVAICLAIAAIVVLPRVAASPAVADDPCPGRDDPFERKRTDLRLPVQPNEAAARRGRFSLIDRPRVKLAVPVDWEQDPFTSEAWRSKLHAMEWLDPLLDLHRRTRSRAALAQARDLMLDWIRANPPTEGFGWADKISGERAESLGYITAASQCAGLLTDSQRETLRDSAQAHATYLADPDNYNPGNHGLSQDRGLIVLTGYLPSLPDADEVRKRALERFRRGLPVSDSEAVGLEHTPNYHFLVLGLTERVLALPGANDPALRTLARRMRAVAGWFVMPNGYLTRLGDTPVKRAPGWALASSRRLQGIAPTLRSGFGIVKVGRSYLSVTAGHHPFGHKQADELTFELYDRGRQIVTDTGRYGARRDRNDPERVAEHKFTKSAQAHSSLVVDDESPKFKKRAPYGSAMTAGGQGAGWWALEGRNPLLASQEVSHTRLFLYRPGSALVVVDRVAAAAQHDYTRLFQFHPGMRVSATGDGRTFALRAPGFEGFLYTAPSAGERGARVVVGRRDPLLGFTSAANRFAPFIPRAAVSYRTRAASTSYVTVISFAGRATATLLRSSPGATTVRLNRPGRAPLRITATRSGSRLQISAAG